MRSFNALFLSYLRALMPRERSNTSNPKCDAPVPYQSAIDKFGSAPNDVDSQDRISNRDERVRCRPPLPIVQTAIDILKRLFFIKALRYTRRVGLSPCKESDSFNFNSFDHSPTSAYAAREPITYLQKDIKDFRFLTFRCFAVDSLIPMPIRSSTPLSAAPMDTNQQKLQWPRGPPLETETG